MSGNLLDAFDDGLILVESGQTTADAIHSLWLAVNSVLQGARRYLTLLDQWQSAVGSTEILRAGATDRVKLAQGFIPANLGAVVQVSGIFVRTGSPTGNIWFTIEGNNAGSPDGSVLGTSKLIDVTTIATSQVALTLTFDQPPSISPGTTYFIVLHGDYTVSVANCISWIGTSTLLYAGGVGLKFNGTVWATPTPKQFYFKLYSQIRVV